MKSELYQIIFPNGKRYIGLSKDAKKRYGGHLKLARKGSKFPVHCAIRKYGEENLKHEVICIGTQDYIADLEIKAIASYQTTDRQYGYNVTLGGELSPMKSPEVRAAVRRAMEPRWKDPKWGQAAADRTRGRKASSETREKLRQSHLGQRPSEAQLAKMRGRVPHNKGIPATPEQKEKHSQIALARYAEKRARGEVITVSKEQRQKISEKLKGHKGFRTGPHTTESKAKMTLGKKKGWMRKRIMKLLETVASEGANQR